MGYKTEFNWVLKLKPEQGLDEDGLETGGVYSFSKAEHRVYPLNIPIHLINKDWEAVGKVEVTEFTVGGGKTTGKYRVLKIYGAEERQMISQATKPE